MKNTKNFLWGIIFIALGVIAAANVLGSIDFDLFFKGWWTLIIILPCFVGLITEKDKTGNIIFLLVGIILLLREQGMISFDIIVKLGVPVAFIAYGIYVLGKATRK